MDCPGPTDARTQVVAHHRRRRATPTATSGRTGPSSLASVPSFSHRPSTAVTSDAIASAAASSCTRREDSVGLQGPSPTVGAVRAQEDASGRRPQELGPPGQPPLTHGPPEAGVGGRGTGLPPTASVTTPALNPFVGRHLQWVRLRSSAKTHSPESPGRFPRRPALHAGKNLSGWTPSIRGASFRNYVSHRPMGCVLCRRGSTREEVRVRRGWRPGRPALEPEDKGRAVLAATWGCCSGPKGCRDEYWCFPARRRGTRLMAGLELERRDADA
ncbi:uncharacterized protein LOC122213641 [Panthera leo]|uniref:uncharacterized protein LOC122213641 n=1 Tax=Panthera leo TaxID=9689 RepID=UPI001C6A3C48|nr:uncharacterized protein LOC122213641 [Panthera leo]